MLVLNKYFTFGHKVFTDIRTKVRALCFVIGNVNMFAGAVAIIMCP